MQVSCDRSISYEALHHAGLSYARIARVVVLEKGLDGPSRNHRRTDTSRGSPYYSINPSGRVPYLIRDDGGGLEDSAVICAYLDQLDGNPIFDLPAGDQAWEARRVGRWREACWTVSRFGAAKLCGLKMSNRPQSSSMKHTAVNEWLTSGRPR